MQLIFWDRANPFYVDRTTPIGSVYLCYLKLRWCLELIYEEVLN